MKYYDSNLSPDFGVRYNCAVRFCIKLYMIVQHVHSANNESELVLIKSSLYGNRAFGLLLIVSSYLRNPDCVIGTGSTPYSV